MAQQPEWSPLRIVLVLASAAFFVRTNLWGVIPRLTSRGVRPTLLPRLRLLRRRLGWLAAALVVAFAAGAFHADPLVKWSLFGISLAALLEALKLSLDLRRLPSPRSPEGSDAEGD